MGTFDPQKGLKNGQKWKFWKMTQKFVISPQKIPRNEYKHYYIIFGPIWPPKRAKNGHAKNVPLLGHIHKNKLLSCSIHHFELPCKKSAQTDKQFLRYSIFKNRAIWLAKSFLAIFVVKKKLKKPYLKNGWHQKILLYSILTRNGDFWWFFGSILRLRLYNRSKKGKN